MRNIEINVFDPSGKQRMTQLRTDKERTIQEHKFDYTLELMDEYERDGLHVVNFKQVEDF